jgi:hypothetical protein
MRMMPSPCPSDLREIPEYPGYFVDSNGGVWSGPKQTRTGYRQLIPHKNGRGYYHVGMRKNNKPRTVKVHYVVAQVFHGFRPEGLVIDHIDNDKTNNHPENLRYITTGHNIRRSQHIQDKKKCKAWNVTTDGRYFKAHKYLSGTKYYLGLYKTEEAAADAVAKCNTVEDVSKIYKPRKLTSQKTGVSLHRSSGKWRAYLGKIHLGWFDTEQEAMQARNAAVA